MITTEELAIGFLNLAKARAIETGKLTVIKEFDRMIAELEEQIYRKSGNNVIKWPGVKK